METEETNNTETPEIHYRDFQVESGNSEARTVEMSVSSEAPVKRNWGGVEGIEVLDHSPDSINLERFENGSAPLLMDHDPGKQIGVIDSIRLDQSQRKLRATARFGNSSLAKEAYADVMDKIRTNISIGYSVNNYDLDEPENRSETPVFRVNDWTLLEVSSVSIPSDFEVGVGRSSNQKPSHYRKIQMENTIEETMEKSVVTDPELRERLEKEAMKADRKRSKEIWEIAGRHSIPHEIVHKAIYDDVISVADFRGVVLDYREKQGTTSAMGALEDTSLGMSEKDVQRFSIAKLLWAEVNPHDKSAQDDASYERDVISQYQKQTGREGKGAMIPDDILVSKKYRSDMVPGQQKRDWNTTNATGGFLIQTDVISFIDRLRHYLFLTDVGITELRGLRGPINIPRLSASQTAYWVAEGSAPTESQGTLQQVSMSPKTVGAYSQLTKKLLIEAKEVPDIEVLIIDDMAKQIAAAIQDKALSGNGASNTPTGLYNSSISTKTCTDQNDPTWAEVVGVWSTLGGNRALSLPRDSFAWICPSGVAGNMMVKTKDSGSGRFVLEDDMRLMGYPVVVSELCSQLTLGAFKELMLCYWSGLDLLTDPYSNGSSGTINFYALQDVDVGVRLTTAFCKTTQ